MQKMNSKRKLLDLRRNESRQNLTGKLFHRQTFTNGCDQRETLFLKARIGLCKSLYKKDIVGHYGCVNAVEFSLKEEQLFVSGGDDRRVLLWKTGSLLRNGVHVPYVMKLNHDSNIFCLSFSHDDKRIFSAGNDHQVILHDTETGDGVDVFMQDSAIHGMSIHPESDNIFCTASEDGQVQVYDVRAPRLEDPLVLVSNRATFQSIMYNPSDGRLLVSSNARDGVQLWDARRPERHLMQYGGVYCSQSAMSARWNSTGDLLLVLRRRMMPVLHHIKESKPIAYFDHPGYYNSCTSKSCSFGGVNDGYVMSGSDNFSVYVWKVPELNFDTCKQSKLVQTAALELKGHRSIVNQVRYNKVYDVIASSGVEKIIKFWSPWPISNDMSASIEHIDRDSEERALFSREDYFNMVLRSGQLSLQNDDDHSTTEDQRMIAFFDTLVQQEIEGSDMDSDEEFPFYGCTASRSQTSQYANEVVDSESSSSSLSSDSDNDPQGGSTRHTTNRLKLLLEPFNGFPVIYSKSSSEDHDVEQSDDVIENTNSTTVPNHSIDNGIHDEQGQSSSSCLDHSTGFPTSSNLKRSITQLIIKKRKENELLKMRQARRRGHFFTDDIGSQDVRFPSRKHSLSSAQVRRRVMLAKKQKNSIQNRFAQIRRHALRSSSSSEDDPDTNEIEAKAKSIVSKVLSQTSGSSTHDGGDDNLSNPSGKLTSTLNGNSSNVDSASVSDQHLNGEQTGDELSKSEENNPNFIKPSKGKRQKYRKRVYSDDSSG